MNRATFEKRFLRITKIFGKLSGIWPDQNKVKFSLWAMVHITMASFVFVQVARIVHIGTLKVVIEQSSIIGTGIVMVVKHGNYILNAKKLKSLLNDMSEDWATDRLKEEVAIMTTYAYRGTTLAMFYLVNACICAFLFLQLPWTVRLMHIMKPHNASLPMVYAIPAYYFVEDDRKYYYYIQMYLGLSIYIVLIVFVGCDTCYMVLVQHACGLLTVAGYRFKNAINDLSFNTRNPEKEAKEINKRLRFSIQGHQRAIMSVLTSDYKQFECLSENDMNSYLSFNDLFTNNHDKRFNYFWLLVTIIDVRNCYWLLFQSSITFNHRQH
ncbi:uncharacterized protein LOC122573582 [Bombus pyrosoma]|uniref:uncharacterized protein LOC122573582 n=1 Tax=Bombus pyrosoma TaxID=396416 RepID=UPI001CB92CA3|nr:uncharacterized protein LOC122573582 [Bombus pyrosoma]